MSEEAGAVGEDVSEPKVSALDPGLIARAMAELERAIRECGDETCPRCAETKRAIAEWRQRLAREQEQP